MYFFRLIRTGNLLFLIILLLVFRYQVLIPLLYKGVNINPDAFYNFLLLTLATVLIAAGGYTINDYYDKGIDKINKPEKLIVGKKISTRRVLMVHFIVTTAGILSGCLLAIKLHSVGLLFAFLIIPALLWYYSAKLKKQLLAGNLLIALLSVLPVILLTFAELQRIYKNIPAVQLSEEIAKTAWTWTGIYTAFTFLLMLAREIVKDMEDVQGDAAFNRKTMATEIGIHKSVGCTSGIIFLLILIMMIVFCINYHIFMPVFIVYIFLFLIIPLIISIILLIRGKNKKDFHIISGLLKAVMLAGILAPAVLNLLP